MIRYTNTIRHDLRLFFWCRAHGAMRECSDWIFNLHGINGSPLPWYSQGVCIVFIANLESLDRAVLGIYSFGIARIMGSFLKKIAGVRVPLKK